MIEQGSMGAESSLNKIFWSEMDIRMHETALELLGAGAELEGDASRAVDGGAWMKGYQFALADIATELEAARWLTYRAAYLRDTGQPFLKEAAMAKLKASRLAVQAASEAVQIHGGLGYMLDSPVARFYCDAKVLEIGEGTNEIQHLVIARALGC
jgi:alkylation response protein AidB-like acyl-CoA dehydrogenase